MPEPLSALLIGFATAQLATFATTIYLHRALAHKAVRLAPGLTFACRFVIWMTTGIKPREWAAVHRRHHAFTDEPADPHSPAQLGWMRVQLTNAALYRRAARDGVTVHRYARDLPADRWDRALFDRSWLGLGLGIVLLIAVLGPAWGAGRRRLAHRGLPGPQRRRERGHAHLRRAARTTTRRPTCSGSRS